MQGNLSKFVNHFFGWQTRYVLLESTSGNLIYYLTFSDFKAGLVRGKFDLRETRLTKDQSDSNVFILDSAGFQWKLKGENIETTEKWCEAIEASILLLKRKTLSVANISSSHDLHKTLSYTHSEKSGPSHPPEGNKRISTFSIASQKYQDIKNRPRDIMHKISDIKSNLYELYTIFQNIKDHTINLPEQESYALKKNILKISTIHKKCIEEFDSEERIFIDKLRRTNNTKDIKYFAYSIYTEDNLKDRQFCHFKTFQSFIGHLMSNNLLEHALSYDNTTFPCFVYQTRSYVEIIAGAFAYSRPIIILLDLPNDLFEQILLIMKSYVIVWKALLMDNNFIGLPLYSHLNEFVRYNFSNGLQIGTYPVLHVVCQHLKQDHRDYYLLYLEDADKTITISFKLFPKPSIIDDNILITISGEGRFVHIPMQKEYSFTFPDIFIRNLFDSPSIDLFGKCIIKNLRDDIYSELHFTSSKSCSSSLHGHIHHGELTYTFEGSWMGLVNIKDSDNNIIDSIKFSYSQLYKRMVPVYTSCHACESKRLWKEARFCIRQRNDENFRISVINAFNQLQLCEFDTHNIFTKDKHCQILHIKHFCSSA